MISGPAGVGKQRLALWLAQLVLCERRESEPCGKCRACRSGRRAGVRGPALVRPDPPPQGGGPGQGRSEEAAEAIAEVMEERRAKPLYGPPDGMASHSMASVRLLHQRASLTSVEGGARIFIIGDAERLVPQESSQEAANALLKLLEEPPAGSLFVLTTVDPRRLLPTIRSRAVPVRLQRLSRRRGAGVPRSEQIEPALAPHGARGARGRRRRARSARRSRRARRAEGVPGRRPAARGGARRDRARSTSGRSGSRPSRPAASSPRCSTRWRTRWARPPAAPWASRPGGRCRRPCSAAATRRRCSRRWSAWPKRARRPTDNVNPQILLAVLGEELAEVL